MNTNILKGVVGVLIIVAVVFGYQIYVQKFPKAISYPKAENKTPAQNSGSDNVVSTDKLLASPGPNASEAEKQAYAKLVIDSATATNKIDISSCTAVPKVASFADGSDVIFSNNDTTEHKIVFDVNTFFVIPAKSSKNVKANFGKGAGIYGFGCDSSRNAVGMVFVMPTK